MKLYYFAGGEVLGIIFKFVAKNIKSNKFRTFLIIFSICVSTALFFSSMAISSTMESMYLQRMKSYYGNSEIIIHPGSESPTRFVNPNKASECEEIEIQLSGALGPALIRNPKKDNYLYVLVPLRTTN